MTSALAIAMLLAGAAVAQESAASRWKGIEFLIGNWIGLGSGEPGAGSGSFAFRPDLGGTLLMRLNQSNLANGTRHEDLMVIYHDGPGGPLRGTYWDQEGHVIRYKVSSPGEGRAIFESEGEGPAYRLSYWMSGAELKGKFEIAGKTYLAWSAKKAGFQ